MNPEWTEKVRSGRLDVAILLVLGAVLFLTGLGNHDLWNPDEPRYFEVCREMAETGGLDGWLVPHVNGRLYTQKPPLLFWSMCAAGKVVGMNETAARLPSALAAMTSIVFVYLLGRLFFSLTAARLAALAYGSCAKILWQGHTGQIDMLLSCMVVIAVYFWARSWVEDRPRLIWGFYAFAGLATLAKGPVGLLPPLLSIAVFFAFHKDKQGLKRLCVLRGLLLWAGVVLLWLVPAILQAGDVYFQEIVYKQNVTRYANPWHHFRPWYYYLSVLPGDFFPWTFFLPAAWVAAWRGLTGDARRRFFFCLSWMVTTLVFFSLSPAKRTVYILTMYPAMALMIGAGLDALRAQVGERTSRHWLTLPAAFVAGLMTLVAGLMTAVGASPALLPQLVGAEDAAEHTAVIEPLGGFGLVLAVGLILAVLAVGAVTGLAFAWRERVGRFAVAFGAGMALTGLLIFVNILPVLDVVKSNRGLAEELVARAAPDEPYAIYPRLDATFIYYSRRYAVELDGEDELHAFVETAKGDRPVWVLMRRQALEELGPLSLVQVAEDADLKNGYVLLRSPREPRD